MFGSTHFAVVSPLTPLECVERLGTVVTPASVYGEGGRHSPRLGPEPAIGEISWSSLRIRKQTDSHNGFGPILLATLRPQDDGTLIAGEVSLPQPLVWIVCAWLATVAVGGGASLFLRSNSVRTENVAFNSLVLFLAVSAFFAWGIYSSRSDAAFLIDLVTRTVEGTQRPD
jgi:hypothetical protein